MILGQCILKPMVMKEDGILRISQILGQRNLDHVYLYLYLEG